MRGIFAFALMAGILAGAGLSGPAAADSDRFELLGRFGGQCAVVDAGGGYAYAGEGTAVRVWDISTPAAPVAVALHEYSQQIREVRLVGTRLHVCLFDAGMSILDVSNPAAPTEWSHIPGVSVTAADAVGDIVYSNSGSLLLVLDVSDPGGPQQLGSVYAAEWIHGIQVVGDYAYIAGQGTGLGVVDVSDPASPETLLGPWETSGNAYDVSVDGSLCCVASADGLDVFTLDDPASPTLARAFDIGGRARGVRVSGSTAHVAAYDIDDGQHPGLRVVDLTDPANPAIVGDLQTIGDGEDVALVDSIAVLAEDYEGVRLIDVSDPANPATLGRRHMASNPRVLATDATRVFTNSFRSVQAIDVSNPAAPVLRAEAAVNDTLRDLWLDGQTLYVANDDEGGLRIYDVSAPDAINELATVDTPGKTYGVVARDGMAYVADGRDGGLRVYDVSNPAAPAPLGDCDTPGDAYSVALYGDYAYVADGDEHLLVMDVSDPTSPSIVRFFSASGGQARDVIVKDDRLYVAYDELGLQVWSLANPASPDYVGNWAPHAFGNEAISVAARNDVVVIANESSSDATVGFYAASEDAGAYDLVQRLPAYGFPKIAAFDNMGRLYAADSAWGLFVYHDAQAPVIRDGGNFWMLH